MPVGAHGPECSWGGGTALGSHDKGRPGLGVWWDTEKATLLTPCCCVVSDRKGPHQRGAGVFRRTEDQAQRQGGAPICCHVQPSHTCAQAAACLGGSGWGGALGGSGPLLRGFWGEGVCLSLEKNGVGPQLLPRQSPAKDRCGCVRTEPSAPVAVEGGKLALGGGAVPTGGCSCRRQPPRFPQNLQAQAPSVDRGAHHCPHSSSAGTCLPKFQCSEATHTAGPASWVRATCLVWPCRTTTVPLHGGGGRLCSSLSPQPGSGGLGLCGQPLPGSLGGPCWGASTAWPRAPPPWGLAPHGCADAASADVHTGSQPPRGGSWGGVQGATADTHSERAQAGLILELGAAVSGPGRQRPLLQPGQQHGQHQAAHGLLSSQGPPRAEGVAAGKEGS